MTRFAKDPLAVVWAIGAGIFVLALIVLLVFADYGIIASIFMSLVIAALATIAIYLGFLNMDDGKAVVAAPAASNATAPAPAKAPETAPPPPSSPAPKADAAPAPAPAAETVSEPGEGKRPAGLDGPRGGGADDLKKIKGVGPKLEKLLNSLGYWHFDQIAAWSAEEVAWVDANLAGFKGRVSRDSWVDQAKSFAAGG